MDHLIDSLAEGVIDKDQFTARMNRTKTRIADIDAKIGAQTSDEGRQANLRSVRSRLAEISCHVRNQLSDADWATKREIIRALIQRIEIGTTKVAVVLRLPTDTQRACPRSNYGDIVTGVKSPALAKWSNLPMESWWN